MFSTPQSSSASSGYQLSSGLTAVVSSPDGIPATKPLTNAAKFTGKITQMELKVLQLEKKIDALVAENEGLRKEIRGQATRFNEELERRLGMVEITMISNLQKLEERVGNKRKREVDEISDDEDGLGVLLKEEVRSIELSEAATHDNSLLELVRSLFSLMMGCPDLLPKNIPFWPQDEAAWPLTADKKNRLTRFRFHEAATHPDNLASLDRILEFIRNHGAKYHAAAAPALRLISEKDLHDRVVKKYKDLQKSLRTAGRIPKRGAAEVTVVEDEPENNGTVVLTKSQQQSRAKGKLEVRERKRAQLPEDSIYRDQKYNHLFVASLMSDDEDQLDENNKKTGLFVSRAPLYRSKIVNECLTAVDGVADPKASTKYNSRVRGPVKDLPPREVRFENRARKWMVDPEWLKKPENRQYDVPSRIQASGRLWGDEKDPEEILAKALEVQAATKKGSKRVKLELMVEKGLAEDTIKTKKGKATAKAKAKGKGKEKSIIEAPIAGPSTEIVDDEEDWLSYVNG